MAKNKIASLAIIKDAKIKPECGDLNFSGFDYTPEQYATIAKWVKDKEQLTITMEPTQKKLPGTE